MNAWKVTKRDHENTPFEELDKDEISSVTRLGLFKLTIDTSRGETIAEVCPNEEYARLIAAAPELLAAARLALSVHDAQVQATGDGDGCACDVCVALSLAIVKAEGRK